MQTIYRYRITDKDSICMIYKDAQILGVNNTNEVGDIVSIIALVDTNNEIESSRIVIRKTGESLDDIISDSLIYLGTVTNQEGHLLHVFKI